MIVYVTSMSEFPKNCLVCTMVNCRLGEKKNTNEREMKSIYTAIRHGECPLTKIDDELLKE